MILTVLYNRFACINTNTSRLKRPFAFAKPVLKGIIMFSVRLHEPHQAPIALTYRPLCKCVCMTRAMFSSPSPEDLNHSEPNTKEM